MCGPVNCVGFAPGLSNSCVVTGIGKVPQSRRFESWLQSSLPSKIIKTGGLKHAVPLKEPMHWWVSCQWAGEFDPLLILSRRSRKPQGMVARKSPNIPHSPRRAKKLGCFRSQVLAKDSVCNFLQAPCPYDAARASASRSSRPQNDPTCSKRLRLYMDIARDGVIFL